MRITGGSLKGSNIKCPPGEIRPTMDMVRESLFSILDNKIQGAKFLDLFGGSGIMSIEAVSRGAGKGILIEKDKGKIPVILQNLSLCPKEKIECHFISAELFLKRTKETFDIIYCDPPFNYNYHMDLLKIFSEGKILNNGGIVLMHHPKEKPLPEFTGKLKRGETKKYGRSILDIYHCRETS